MAWYNPLSWFESSGKEKLKVESVAAKVKRTRKDVVKDMTADVKENLNQFTAAVQARLEYKAEHYWKRSARTITRLQYRFDAQYPSWRELEGVYDHTTPMGNWFAAEELNADKQTGGTYFRIKEMHPLRLEVSSPELRNAAGYVYLVPYIDTKKMEGWWVILEATREKDKRGFSGPYTYLAQRYNIQRNNRKNLLQEINAEKIGDNLLQLADFGPFK